MQMQFMEALETLEENGLPVSWRSRLMAATLPTISMHTTATQGTASRQDYRHGFGSATQN
jgi:hypothetical protein